MAQTEGIEFTIYIAVNVVELFTTILIWFDSSKTYYCNCSQHAVEVTYKSAEINPVFYFIYTSMWATHCFTFSLCMKQETALSMSTTAFISSETEIATAAAISEGLNSKKSIPALNSHQRTAMKLH